MTIKQVVARIQEQAVGKGTLRDVTVFFESLGFEEDTAQDLASRNKALSRTRTNRSEKQASWFECPLNPDEVKPVFRQLFSKLKYPEVRRSSPIAKAWVWKFQGKGNVYIEVYKKRFSLNITRSVP